MSIKFSLMPDVCCKVSHKVQLLVFVFFLLHSISVKYHFYIDDTQMAISMDAENDWIKHPADTCNNWIHLPSLSDWHAVKKCIL